MTASQPAGWYPDPSRRHEHRYWDGVRWTDHVSSQGITASDPVPDRGSPVAGSTGDGSTLTRAERQAQLRRGGQRRTQEAGPTHRSPATPAEATSFASLPKTTSVSKRKLTRGQAIVGTVVLLVIIGAILSAAGVKSNNSNSSGSPSGQSLSDWASQNLANVHTMQNALNAVTAAAGAQDLSGLRTACESLQGASQSLAGGLPSPNTALNDALTGATTDYTSAASSCINGVNDNNSTEIDQATTEIQDGTTQINIATGILNQVNSGG